VQHHAAWGKQFLNVFVPSPPSSSTADAGNSGEGGAKTQNQKAPADGGAEEGGGGGGLRGVTMLDYVREQWEHIYEYIFT